MLDARRADFSVARNVAVALVLVPVLLACGAPSPASPTVVIETPQATSATPTVEPRPTEPTKATPTRIPPPTPTPLGPWMVLDGASFILELAITPEERSAGLSGRSPLGNNDGMLFIYEQEEVPGFWMRGMLFALDIVWIDSDGVVVGVSDNLPPAMDGSVALLYHPPRPVQYVLEVNAGTAERLGVALGSSALFYGIPARADS